MAHQRPDPPLALEALPVLAPALQRRVRELERDVPARLAVLGLVDRAAGTLAELAGIASVELLTEANRPAGGAATLVVEGVENLIALSDLGVSAQDEADRLTKAIAKAEKEIGRLEKRLNNPKFMERAPEEVRAEVRDKHAQEAARLTMLRRSLERATEGL